MGQDHEFLLVSYDEDEEMGYDRYYPPAEDLSNIVLIHDDVIQYLQDTLNWIPSINPAMNYQKRFGLCNYGSTLFDKQGANTIYNLAKAWADLFFNGPTTLKLTGNYRCITLKDGIPVGEYNLLEVNRDKLVENLRKLQLFSEKVISGDYLILHHGI
jgi:hypothetical protein